MGPRDWYVPLAGDAAPRLFAFPHAGAGSARLVRFARAAAPDVAVWAANLPGRQARLHEPPVTNLGVLVEELTEHLVDLARPPYALFGYCGGAVIALLVARALRERGHQPPAAMIVTSAEAPDIGYRPSGLAGLPSDRLWARLATEGGVGDDVIADERLRQVAEPAVRADFAMLGGYRYRPAPPLSCPMTVCFGTEDGTPRGAWLGWRRQTTAPLQLQPLVGGHWLLEEAAEELAAVAVKTVVGDQ